MNENSALVCRIKQEPIEHFDNVIPSKTGSRKVLVDVGMGRRKIFLLDNTNSLCYQFCKFASSDPALCSLLNNTFPIFQEYNKKFETWVDIDCEENLVDGAVLKVVFFPTAIEASSSNPTSLKQKRDDCDSSQKLKRCCIQHLGVENNSCSWNVYTKKNVLENVCPENKSISFSPATQQLEKQNTFSTSNNVLPEIFSFEKKDQPPFQCNSLDIKCIAVKQPIQNVSTPVALPVRKENKMVWVPEKIDIQKTEKEVENVCPEIKSSSHLSPLKLEIKKQKQRVGNACPKSKSSSDSIATLQQKKNKLNTSCSSSNDLGGILFPKETVLPTFQYDPLSRKCIVVKQPTQNVKTPPFIAPPVSKGNKKILVSEKNDINKHSTAANVQPPNSEVALMPRSHPEPEPRCNIFERVIEWNRIQVANKKIRQKRKAWALQNIEKNWTNALFSSIALFDLKGNSITHIREFSQSKNCMLFWGSCSANGLNMIHYKKFSALEPSTFVKLFKNNVKWIKPLSENHRVTLEYIDRGSLYKSKLVQKFLKTLEIGIFQWPKEVRDLFPLELVWDLIAEKLKSVHCSSNQEMISMVSKVWRTDSDVQNMYSKIISLLPQIIKSVIEEEGDCPKVNVKF